MAGRRERQASGGFASRLREVIDAYGSASALAKAIDRSEGAVRKWLRGESEPNVTDVRTLCETTHTSIEWLVTGRGIRQGLPPGVRETSSSYPGPAASPPQTLDHALLEKVVDTLDEELRRTGAVLATHKRAALITTVYAMSYERRAVDPEAVTRLVKLAG